jgi:hypothetical protein
LGTPKTGTFARHATMPSSRTVAEGEMAGRRGSKGEHGHRGERWAADAGSADVAVLDIPASAQRDRVFEIDVRFVVRSPSSLEGAWHELNVELGGRQQWSRRIDTHNAGETDSLDYHCRREVPAGQALRVRATTRVDRAARARLTIEAEEAQA